MKNIDQAHTNKKFKELRCFAYIKTNVLCMININLSIPWQPFNE